MEIKVKTCIIHRYTLYNNDICFKCDAKCLSVLNVFCFNCLLCYGKLDHKKSICIDCFSCLGCGRFNRLEGYCKFCGIFFNENIIKKLFHQNPSKIFCYLFDSDFSFNDKNNQNNIEKNLIKIILNYL